MKAEVRRRNVCFVRQQKMPEVNDCCVAQRTRSIVWHNRQCQPCDTAEPCCVWRDIADKFILGANENTAALDLRSSKSLAKASVLNELPDVFPIRNSLKKRERERERG